MEGRKADGRMHGWVEAWMEGGWVGGRIARWKEGSNEGREKDGREASMLGISVWQGVQHCVGSARDTM